MLTPIDEIANQNHLQLIKAAVAFLPPPSQRSLSLLIKLLGTTYFLYLTFGGPNGMGYFAYVISRIPNCVIFAALVFVLLPIIQRVIVVRIIK